MMKDEKMTPIEMIGQDKNGELEKEKVHVVDKLIDYIPNAVLSRTILKKTTGNVTAMAFDTGEEIGEKSVPFDTYIQIIDGSAHVTIDNTKHSISLGSGIVIPAHRLHAFNANEKFKMLSTVIKSGYEDFPPVFF